MRMACRCYCRGLVAERDLEPGTELLLEAPLTCLCGPVCQQPTAEDLVHAQAKPDTPQIHRVRAARINEFSSNNKTHTNINLAKGPPAA
jgi:hypothetical protein